MGLRPANFHEKPSGHADWADGGADPLVRAGRPRPAAGPMISASCRAPADRRGRRPRARGSAASSLEDQFFMKFRGRNAHSNRRGGLSYRAPAEGDGPGGGGSEHDEADGDREGARGNAEIDGGAGQIDASGHDECEDAEIGAEDASAEAVLDRKS